MSHDPKNSPPAKGEYPEGGRGLVPKLRFPEFREAGEWEYLELDPFLRGYSERVSSNTDLPIYSSTRTGLKFQKDYYDDRELANDGEYGLVPEGYFVYRHMSDDGAFKFNINKTGGKIAVSKEYPVFTTVGLNSDFLLYLLNDGEDFKAFAFAQKKGGTRTRLYLSVLRTWKALLPSYPEQQKIADCLASLDELITLEAQKLDTLKTHKKGLMQQLFPAKGETVPKLRFPEFLDAGEWEEKSIQELIDLKVIIGHLDGNHGGLYPRSDEFSERGIPYISANDFASGSVNFSKCKHLPEKRAKLFKKGMAKNGDILFAHNATVGPVAKLETTLDFVILSTTATYFRCDNRRLVNDFMEFLLSSLLFVEQYTRVMKQSTRNQVPITAQRKFKLVLPKREEQQKIADCLASLDDLITAQTQKLAALKNHKKGLMQQLFPAPDDGQA